MNTFITVLSIIITISTYLVSKIVSKKYPSPFTTPVLFSTVFIILFLLIFDIDLNEYANAKDIMTSLLGPATVALAIPLYKNRAIIKKNALAAIAGILIGSVSALVSGVVLAKIMHFSNSVIASVYIKSATVPVAVEIAKLIEADSSLTAAFVIGTGIIGSVIGPPLMNLAGITNPLSRGLALGTISHGIGTAEATGEGELQGAVAGIAMGIGAIFLSLVAPTTISFFL